MLTCRTALLRTAEYYSGILHRNIVQALSAEELVELEREATVTKVGLAFLVSGSL
jgi:hypothetical protein